MKRFLLVVLLCLTGADVLSAGVLTGLRTAEVAVGVATDVVGRMEVAPMPPGVPLDEATARSCYGLRLGWQSSRLYQGRPSVYGLDLGFFNDLYVPATHLNRLYGWQLSLAFNEVHDGAGLQTSFWNVANRSFWGLQLGALNEVHGGGGFQVGVQNDMYAGGGFQIGLVNRARPGVCALQIGLLNLGALGCFPLIGITDAP